MKIIIMIIMDIVLAIILIAGIINNIDILTKLAIIVVVLNTTLYDILHKLKYYKKELENKIKSL